MITQRILDAAHLLLETAATHTDQTGCTLTNAIKYAEDWINGAITLTPDDLIQAKHLASTTTLSTQLYSREALTRHRVRADELREAASQIKQLCHA